MDGDLCKPYYMVMDDAVIVKVLSDSLLIFSQLYLSAAALKAPIMASYWKTLSLISQLIINNIYIHQEEKY